MLMIMHCVNICMPVNVTFVERIHAVYYRGVHGGGGGGGGGS